MVVKSIGVHDKVYVDAVWLVHNKSILAVAAVIGDMEFVTNFLQGKDYGDCVGIKPNITVLFDMSLHIGGESSTTLP